MEDEAVKLRARIEKLEKTISDVWHLYQTSQVTVGLLLAKCAKFENEEPEEPTPLLVHHGVPTPTEKHVVCSQQIASTAVESSLLSSQQQQQPSRCFSDSIPPTELPHRDVVEFHSQLEEDCPASPDQLISCVGEPLPPTTTTTTNNNQKEEETHEVKYADVVRGKKAREALPGHACEECLIFYETIGKSLHPGEDKQTVMNRYSRHRHRHAKPGTPPGYWDIWSLPEESQPQKPLVKKSRKRNVL